MTAIARELDYPDQAADQALADILAKLNVSLAVTGPLTDGQLRANPVPVDVGGNLAVTASFQSRVSSLNVPTTPLGANATFTGSWEDVRDYASIAAVVLTDQASAYNGVIIDFSDDGVTALRSVAATIPANIGTYFELTPEARYFRVRYTNGPVAQTMIRSQIILRFNTPGLVQTPLGAPTNDLNVAGITKAHLAVRNPSTGGWQPLSADTTGKVNVLGPATDVELRATPLPVSNTSLPLPSGASTDTTLAEVRDRLPTALDTDGSMKVADVFTGGEALADQTGDGTVKTFTFASPVDLVWVRCVAVAGRCDPFGGTPSASQGIYCAADEPNPMTIRTSSVKVFAASGQISVWGYRG